MYPRAMSEDEPADPEITAMLGQLQGTEHEQAAWLLWLTGVLPLELRSAQAHNYQGGRPPATSSGRR
jgi:hypothetical protein